ncbi:TetR/AcrR family transcriptional regulator [Novosphingobium sp. 9U]|uniref:TetR/AcrR family transcriptional regulator n=1 Tax=Novosphingobium sp. 9U TaxID=2653158 RepID=UPI00135973B3|nr:TetR/AcrR family transcriptional regulator [Novosphingobium sp. 9U]
MAELKQTRADAPPTVAKPRRGRPPLDPVTRRNRILEAASALFTSGGYQETTVEAVGKAAGVTKRTIYELIGDKTELFRAVCDHCHANISALQLDLPISGDSLRSNLLQLGRELVTHSLAEETIAVERTIVVEHARFPEFVRTLNDQGRTSLNRKIAIVFDELRELGMISGVDSFLAAEIFFDLVVGNLGFRKALGFDEPPPSQAETAERVDIFIEGYLRRHGLPKA